MGGHQTKQTVADTTDVVTNAVLENTQDCLSYVSGVQETGVWGGKGNIVSGNVQDLTLSVSMGCVDNITQKGDFTTNIQNSIAQALKDQAVAMTQWADAGFDGISADINSAVATNIKLSNVQKCVKNLAGSQFIGVRGGDYNVVTDNTQRQTGEILGDCLMSGAQEAEAVTTVTNVINQKSEYTSENPLAFITDAIAAFLKSAIAIVVLVFIIFIALIVIAKTSVKALKKQKAKSGGNRESRRRGF